MAGECKAISKQFTFINTSCGGFISCGGFMPFSYYVQEASSSRSSINKYQIMIYVTILQLSNSPLYEL